SVSASVRTASAPSNCFSSPARFTILSLPADGISTGKKLLQGSTSPAKEAGLAILLARFVSRSRPQPRWHWFPRMNLIAGRQSGPCFFFQGRLRFEFEAWMRDHCSFACRQEQGADFLSGLIQASDSPKRRGISAIFLQLIIERRDVGVIGEGVLLDDPRGAIGVDL